MNVWFGIVHMVGILDKINLCGMVGRKASAYSEFFSNLSRSAVLKRNQLWKHREGIWVLYF